MKKSWLATDLHYSPQFKFFVALGFVNELITEFIEYSRVFQTMTYVMVKSFISSYVFIKQNR